MEQLTDYLVVGLGGALGTMGRYWLGDIIGRRYATFPVGTLVINVTGSFLIAFFSSLTVPESRFMVSPRSRAFFMTGICGGYTTFSSFSLQTLGLAQDGEWLYAGAYIALSVILCLLAAWAGHVAAVSLRGKGGQL